jgi:TP901 family phage tail tape measure protein
MDVLTASAKGSAVGLGAVQDVAGAVRTAITAYGAETLSAARAADILFKSVREGGAEASQLAPALGRVLGISAELGVSFEETGAFIATFTRLGVDAEEAVVALRGVLSTILSPTKETAEALADVGLSAEDLRAKVSSQGLTKTLLELITAFEGNQEALGKLFPNIRALAGVLGTAGSQSEQFTEVLAAIESGTEGLDEAFQETKKGTQQSLRETRASLEALALEVGKTILPAMRGLAEALTAILKVVGQLPEPVQTAFAAFLFIGPAALAINGVVTALQAMNTLLGPGGSLATTLVQAASKTGPFGLLAAAIGGLAIVVAEQERAHGSVTRLITDTIADLTRLGTEAQTIAADYRKTFGAIFENASQWIKAGKDAAGGFVGAVAGGISGAGTAISAAVEGALAAGMKILGDIGTRVFGAGKEFIRNFAKGILAAIGLGEGALDTVLGRMREYFGKSPPTRGPLVGIEKSGRELISRFAAGVTGGEPTLLAAAGSVLNTLRDGILRTLDEMVRGILRGTLEIKEAFRDLGEFLLVEFGRRILGALVDQFFGAVSSMLGIAAKAGGLASGGGGAIASVLGSAVGTSLFAGLGAGLGTLGIGLSGTAGLIASGAGGGAQLIAGAKILSPLVKGLRVSEILGGNLSSLNNFSSLATIGIGSAGLLGGGLGIAGALSGNRTLAAAGNAIGSLALLGSSSAFAPGLAAALGLASGIFALTQGHVATGLGTLGGLGIGAGAGFLVGGPIGALIGAGIGAAFGGLFGGLFERKPPPQELGATGLAFPGFQFSPEGRLAFQPFELGGFRAENVRVRSFELQRFTEDIRASIAASAAFYQQIFDTIPQEALREVAEAIEAGNERIRRALEHQEDEAGGNVFRLLADRLPKAFDRAFAVPITEALRLTINEWAQKFPVFAGKVLGPAIAALDAQATQLRRMAGGNAEKYRTALLEFVAKVGEVVAAFELFATMVDSWKTAIEIMSQSTDDLRAQLEQATRPDTVRDVRTQLQAFTVALAAEVERFSTTGQVDLQRINDLVTQRYILEIQFIQQIEAMIKSIGQSIEEQIFGLRLQAATPTEQLALLQAELRTVMVGLAGAIDPAQVGELTQRAQQLVQQLVQVQEQMGAPIQAVVEGAIATLQEVQRLATEQLRTMQEAVRVGDEEFARLLLGLLDEFGIRVKGGTEALNNLHDVTVIARDAVERLQAAASGTGATFEDVSARMSAAAVAFLGTIGRAAGVIDALLSTFPTAATPGVIPGPFTPTFQLGGFVAHDTLARLHAGEFVVPASAVRRGSSQHTIPPIHVHVEVDSREIGQVVIADIERLVRAGRRPIPARAVRAT